MTGAVFLEKLGVKNFGMIKALQGIQHCTLYIFYDILNDVSIYQGFYTGGPEFIGQRRFHDDPDAGEQIIRVDMIFYQWRIVKHVGLDVHGNIIHQSIINELRYNPCL